MSENVLTTHGESTRRSRACEALPQKMLSYPLGEHRRKACRESCPTGRRTNSVSRALGQGDDVDLPPQRHLHFHLFSDLVHECTNIHHHTLAQPERSLRTQHRESHIPLILIAIMTMVLITSSGTMAMAVNFGYRRHRSKTTALMLMTAGFGATFVGMQAFEWTKLITEGVRPWGNPWGAPQFGSCFFMITASTACTSRRAWFT